MSKTAGPLEWVIDAAFEDFARQVPAAGTKGAFHGGFAEGMRHMRASNPALPDDAPTSEQIDLARFVLSEECSSAARQIVDLAVKVLFKALGGKGDPDD